MSSNTERNALYAALAASFASLAFSVNAQRRLAYVEYDTVDKYENVMHLIGQNAQRLNALESSGYRPTFEGEGGHFE